MDQGPGPEQPMGINQIKSNQSTKYLGGTVQYCISSSVTAFVSGVDEPKILGRLIRAESLRLLEMGVPP